MWLFFALLTPFFWASVHVMDSHCVKEVFDKPWLGMVTSALASMVVFLILPFLIPFVNWHVPEWSIIGIALLAGAFIQLSQVFYFQALAYSEAGIVAAYWNLTPALLPVASFFFLDQILEVPEYMGIGILIFSSVCFCLLDTNFALRWRSLFLMLGASVFQVAALLLEDRVYQEESYVIGFFLVTIGLILTGIFPLVVPSALKVFRNNLPALRPAMGILVGIEVMNLFALASSQRAIDLGVPSLVAAVETMVPAYTFLLALLLLSLMPRFGDPLASSYLLQKFGLVGVMVGGVWLLS